MARPRIGLHAYVDIIPFLQHALESTITMNCTDASAAIRTNQRMNQLRVLQRQENNGESPYDALIFRRRGAQIIVERRGPPAISVTDADGQEIDVKYFVPAMTAGDIERTIRDAPKRANNFVEAQIAWQHKHIDKIKQGVPVLDDPPPKEEDYEPPIREHLHEIDPKKPLLDDIADK